MNLLLSHKSRLKWAAVLVPAVAAFQASAETDSTVMGSALHLRAAVYSVINLGPDAGSAVLNQRGQAAFTSWMLDEGTHGFFDGTRVHPIGSLGGSYTYVHGLNDWGVVVGRSTTASNDYQAFFWTPWGGMRALPRGGAFPGPTDGIAHAINNRNQVVGRMRSQSVVYPHAKRWDPNGAVIHLGPLSASQSTAYDINDSGVSAGDVEVERGDSHAVVWDAKGAATDLGTFGGSYSTSISINARSQVLGYFNVNGSRIGFLWSPGGRVARIGGEGSYQNVTALNDRGEVAGYTVIAEGSDPSRQRPFIWSAQRGLRPLSLSGDANGEALSINNRSEIVGMVDLRPADGDFRNRRATYWSGLGSSIDLNTRLHRAPAGLVLHSARAINDMGAILADSNAGLVLLRPGRTGTAAPVLGPITGAADDNVVPLNSTVDFTVNFVDSAVAESHVATASLDDGCPQPVPSLRERRGIGDVSLRHLFCRPGYVTLKVTVRDRSGNATKVERTLLVTDPSQ